MKRYTRHPLSRWWWWWDSEHPMFCDTHSLIYLYINLLKRSHPFQLQEKTSTGQVWNLPKVRQPLRVGGKIQTQAAGLHYAIKASQWFSLRLMKKAKRKKKFIKQFQKALYKSSWNTLQGLGAYDKHFLTIAFTFESTLLLWVDHKHISAL